MEPTALNDKVKNILVENLMLQLSPSDIADDQPLFGPNSLGLDSVDALQIVVALDKHFGLKIADPAAAKKILENINSIVAAIREPGNFTTSGDRPEVKFPG